MLWAVVLEGLVATLVALYFYCKWRFRYWQRRNVPCLETSIPWGNYTTTRNFGEILVSHYAALKARGCRYGGFYLFTRPVLVLVDPALIKFVMTQNFQCFPDRNVFNNVRDDPISGHLLSVNGTRWRTMRSNMTPTFSSSKMKMMFKMLVACDELLTSQVSEHYQQNQPIEVKQLFANCAIDFIAQCAFGLDVGCLQKEFRHYTSKSVHFDALKALGFALGSAYPELCRMLGLRQIMKECADFYLRTVKETVEYRIESGTARNDFMQLLITMKTKNGAEPFSLEEIAAQCFIFILAGYETSSKTSALALFEIARHEEVQERLREEICSILDQHDGEISYETVGEMKYLDQVVHETLRLHSPIYFAGRVATASTQLPDTDLVIDEGTWVLVSLRGLHLDPDHFPEPHNFDPERFSEDNRKSILPYTFVPFGEGPRNCIGWRLGLLQVKVALATILRKYRFTVNSRTRWPFELDKNNFLYDVQGGIYLDCIRNDQFC